ncbi:hypothetical protein HXX76_010386 [Chlamydomonas incerta]|uniref:MD-2-related lipid-recognition domain-containing protein n=1 Tax=Chlamydomonas incerta TaxID=51695 RepID=A0A835S947_CHLIN|nr:hypothetical protein HXX76_010386 [Chlamydomonas incerta]|eukprot:KAG2422604.1 hypothetical protein HXX76_010386 [Chlamydomonas incerta]
MLRRGGRPLRGATPRVAAPRTAVAARQLQQQTGRRGTGATTAPKAVADSGGSHGGGGGGGNVAGGMSWRVCGGGPPGGAMLQPDDVSLTPDPPHHGRTMDINVTGTTPVSTPGGRFQVAVSYLGVRVYTYETQLCDAMPCPLQAGAPFRLQVSQKLPVLAPPGPYTMEITGDADSGGRFMCVAISFNVASPGSRPGGSGAGGGQWQLMR